MQITLPLPAIEIRSQSYKELFQALLQSSLDFHGENSTYSSHSIHAFPAKFPPQLPRLFIENLTEANDVVLDPMAGSSTTLLEAITLNRRALGVDIDPLALKIGNVKLAPKSIADIECEGLQAVSRAEDYFKKNRSRLNDRLKRRYSGENLEFIEYWFQPETRLELLALLQEIENVEDRRIRNFLLLNFSSTIITKSGGVSMAMDLAHTRPHRVVSKPVRSAFEEFAKRLKRNLKNINGAGQPDGGHLLAAGTVERLPLADNSVDLIVTSPPYASNAIDYMRAHKFSLAWFGYSIKTLGKLRSRYIGGESLNGIEMLELPGFSRRIVEVINKVDHKKAMVLHRYYSEMTLIFREVRRVLRPGKAAVIVVGNSIMRGISTETAECLGEIGEQAGLELVHIGVRHLDRDKRMLPARRQGKPANSKIEERMHEEYVIGFLKPGG
ncbi:MAG: hypothetical protein HYZ24_15465 [Chloroflexi bacterium]|nr:hypothetical protein [Chloroflexota bacterium]